MNQSNNLLNPSDSVFQITESLKKNFRIKSKLVRSNTIQEPKIKPNLTLPNIAKNSKTPKNAYRSNFLIAPATNSDNSPRCLSSSFNKLKTPNLEILRIQEDQIVPSDPQDTFIPDSSILLTSDISGLSKSTCPSKMQFFSSLPVRKPNLNKYKFDDPYLYSKFMKNQETTPFQKILATVGDSNTNFYPYFTRVARELKKTEAILIPKIIKNPRSYKNCSCASFSHKSFAREMPKENDLKQMCDQIVPYVINEHDCEIRDCYLVINFEGVIGYISENKLKLRRGAIKFMQKASKLFRIIIVSNSQRIVSTIANVMENKVLKISAIYYFQSAQNKEIMHLGKICADFQIKSPARSVLVISSLNSELSKSEPIFPTIQRIQKKLNVSMCPVSHEYSPITFLIQHMLINLNSRPLDSLWNSFSNKTLNQNFSFEDWLKDFRIKFRVIRSTLPFEIMMEKMPLKKNNTICKLHNKLVLQSEELPFNYFLLYHG